MVNLHLSSNMEQTTNNVFDSVTNCSWCRNVPRLKITSERYTSTTCEPNSLTVSLLELIIPPSCLQMMENGSMGHPILYVKSSLFTAGDNYYFFLSRARKF